MKKISLLLMLLFQITILFAQQKEINKKGPTGIVGLKQTKQYIPPANANTNDQAYQSNCYTGLAFTVKNYGYDKDGKYYSWGIKVKNNYAKAVSLRYKFVVGGEYYAGGGGTVTYNIKPGQTYDNDYGTIRALIYKNSSTQYRIEVSEVCFEGQDCSRNGYADCNGKQIGVQGKTANNNNPTSNNSIIDMTIVNVKPEYPGGFSEAYRFIGSKIKYPTLAVENDIKGTVIASFTVELDGSISEIKIVKSLGYGCDEEVIRVLQAMPKWKPGMQNGKPVRVRISLPVKFN